MPSLSEDPGGWLKNWGVRIKTVFTEHTPEVIVIFFTGFILGKIFHL